jgi:hypothetical protein
MGDSETGVPTLKLDATSPVTVTKNSVQIYSEKPYCLQEHMLDGTPPLAFNLQSPGVTKNSVNVCNDENQTLATTKGSSIITRSPLRRSVRLAKRRSIGQRPQAAGYSPLLENTSNFPVPSLLSPVSKKN